MKLSDPLAGLVIVALGAAVALVARTFPPMPGQNIGPALFPTIIGLGLATVGIILIVSGRRRAEAPVRLDADMRRPRMALNFAAVLFALLAYAVVVDRLGFFLTAAVLLAFLFRLFGVSPGRTVALALVVPIVMHYGFYTLLRVPLPWGVFENMAW